MESKVQIIRCGGCGVKLRIPNHKGLLQVTCPKCRYSFQYYSGAPAAKPPASAPASPPKPPVSPKPPVPQEPPAQRPKPVPPKPPAPAKNRIVTVQRLTHTYKEINSTGIANMFRDYKPVHIYLDDADQGTLQKEGGLTLRLDANPHKLKVSLFGSEFTIPGGTENYAAYYFNDSLRIGMTDDPFRDALTVFILKMFRGKGMKDRILDSNNRNHNVKLSIREDGIRLSWQLNQTKGWKQWSTGGDEEHISYHQAGLNPPPSAKQPGGYWPYLQDWVESAIEQDDESDLTKDEFGGFTIGKRHKLF